MPVPSRSYTIVRSALDPAEVVFILDNVPDWQTLVDGAAPGAAVVLLDSRGDGLAQMAAYLEGQGGLDAVRVITTTQAAA